MDFQQQCVDFGLLDKKRVDVKMIRYEFKNNDDAVEHIRLLLLCNSQANFRLLKLDDNCVAIEVFDMSRDKK